MLRTSLGSSWLSLSRANASTYWAFQAMVHSAVRLCETIDANSYPGWTGDDVMARSVRPGDYAFNLLILAAAGGLLVSAGFIYWACEYFVNGVEWVGRKTGVSQNAV